MRYNFLPIKTFRSATWSCSRAERLLSATLPIRAAYARSRGEPGGEGICAVVSRADVPPGGVVEAQAEGGGQSEWWAAGGCGRGRLLVRDASPSVMGSATQQAIYDLLTNST